MKVSEAAERYDTDAAGVWELVADGALEAHKPDGLPWIITDPADELEAAPLD